MLNNFENNELRLLNHIKAKNHLCLIYSIYYVRVFTFLVYLERLAYKMMKL